MKKGFTGTENSNIANVSYDDTTNDLFVEFKNGAVFSYNCVPETIFTSWRDADNSARYFVENIKDRYIFKKIKDKKYEPTAEECREAYDVLTNIFDGADESARSGDSAYYEYERNGSHYYIEISKIR